MITKDKLEYYKDLLFELTKKDIKVRYKNSYLGYLWSIANPLFLALIFYFVFKVVSKIQMPNYTLFLISGLFVWQWINNSIMVGSNLYISNSSLIKKVNFPRNFLVISLVLSEGFNFLLSIPVIIFFMLLYSQTPSFNWLIYIPILLIISFIFIYSLALLIATINLFFRDMERLVGLLLTFIFYLTPIIYPQSMVPQKYKVLLYLDPFAPIIISWQKLFLESKLDFISLFLALIYSLIFLFLATKTYNNLKYKFAELV
jgi:lipopolysaccharide transport system permease protein